MLKRRCIYFLVYFVPWSDYIVKIIIENLRATEHLIYGLPRRIVGLIENNSLLHLGAGAGATIRRLAISFGNRQKVVVERRIQSVVLDRLLLDLEDPLNLTSLQIS